jgi:hypothetical protein
VRFSDRTDFPDVSFLSDWDIRDMPRDNAAQIELRSLMLRRIFLVQVQMMVARTWYSCASLNAAKRISMSLCFR